ncbi:OsmC family protein [Acinetobacter bereziniae]|jgi:putative redox protein|uniref:OsmC family protein n=1 Tax=Acinetobacter TaxID=469 RepID=UPI000EF6EAB3|nr:MULTISPECIES: OsmC family protein [Acinetobacter]MBJ8421621.1 OsmC family protein [Acinetobacter bereziniae]MCU4473356.1 OsmC family protein [Acinetobacter bereziniae]MCU4541886.1 OsmC family protein [Acinetobacter bereziniae]MCU4625416.1 OsmC family protein [Acinetobacter bereziniae]BCX71991.1 osmotically inducible protein C [Acinetobacter sp. Tol 5]
MAIIANAKVKTYPEPWSGEVLSGKHQLITDKPESFGGQDKGLAPYDFVCSGLISCTMITLRMYAQHKGFDLGEFTVEADFNVNKEGKEWIERRLSFANALSEELHQKVLDICQKTPVTKTLLRSVEINTSII